MITRSHAFLLVVVLLVPGFTSVTYADDSWTRFRGPNGSGISSAKGFPVEFSEKDFAWTATLPGGGYSQAVAWKETLYVTTAPEDGSTRDLAALSLKDGSLLWSVSYPGGTYRLHRRNHYAVSTACVDVDGVYISYTDGKAVFLAGVSHDGKKLWKKDLGPYTSSHGFGPSPMVADSKVILQLEMAAKAGEDSPSFVVALNTKDGSDAWRFTLRACRKASYVTPVLSKDGSTLLSSSYAHGLFALALSDGSLQWEAEVFDKRTVSTPVLAGDAVIGTCGSGGGANTLAAVKLGGKGDVLNSHTLFKVTRTVSYVPSPLVSGERLYMVSDRGGILTCLNSATGKEIWKGRLGADMSASPVLTEGRLYFVSDDGQVFVVEDSDTFKILATNSLGARSAVTPAIAGNSMIFRCGDKLMCLRAGN